MKNITFFTLMKKKLSKSIIAQHIILLKFLGSPI